ncbi:MAG: hypothetical protein II411_00925, partial [Lachnospiraceae bacterium]|nr:hypothetical protein [Lachnospiraceae bacterium]
LAPDHFSNDNSIRGVDAYLKCEVIDIKEAVKQSDPIRKKGEANVIKSKVTDMVINNTNKPIKGLKLCLNGHKLTVKNTKTLFALTGECFITDCQETHGTIEYDESIRANVEGSLFKFVETQDESGNEIANSLGVFSKNGVGSDPHLTFKNVPVKDSNTAFVTGLENKGELRLEEVKLSNNNITHSFAEIGGNAYIDTCDIVNNTINKENVSFLELHEPNTGNESTDKADIYVSGGEYNGNNMVSKGSSLIHIKADSGASNIYLQEGQFGDQLNVTNNNISDVAVISITSKTRSKGSEAALTIREANFERNYIANDKTFTEIKGGALYISNIYGASDRGVHIDETTFEDNGLQISDGANNYSNYSYATSGTKKLYGGAIYMEGSGDNTVSLAPVFAISNTVFEKNFAYEGGALYLKNSRAIEISGVDTKLTGNFANDGSLVYMTQDDANVHNRGSLTFTNVDITNNGINYGNAGSVVTSGLVESKSAIYYSAKGTDSAGNGIKLNFISTNITSNYAKDGVLKIGDTDNYNKISFSGDDSNCDIKNNGLYNNNLYYAGPVINFVNNTGFNPEVQMYASGERKAMNFINNHVGSSKAVTVTNAASASILFDGKVLIRNNFDNNSMQANVKVKPGFTFTALDTFDAVSSYVYFNTDNTTSEMPLVNWNFNGDCLANPGIEHFYNDTFAPSGNKESGGAIESAVSNDTVIYKGNNAMLYIGHKKFANPVYAFYKATDLTSGPSATQLALWARRGDEVQFDQYTQESLQAPIKFNGFKKYANSDSTDGYTAGEYYVGKTTDGKYRTWGFINNSDHFFTNTYKVSKDEAIEHIDFIWIDKTHTTNHSGHTSAHGTSFGTNWYVAYTENFIHATYPDDMAASNKNEPGDSRVNIYLKNDLQLTRTIEDSTGINICLSGKNLYAPVDGSIVKLTTGITDNVDTNTAKRISILDCQNAENGLRANKTDSKLKAPLFELNGNTRNTPANEATLYLQGVNILGLDYQGNKDGVIIEASYSNVLFKNVSIYSNKMLTNRTPEIKFNSHTPIVFDNSKFEIDGLTIDGIGTNNSGNKYTNANDLSIGNNGFIYMYGSETYYDELTSKDAFRNVLYEPKNIKLRNIHFDSEKAFFNLEDVMGDVEEGDINITNLLVSADGSNDNVSAETDAIKYSGVNNYHDKAKGGLFYINLPSDQGIVKRDLNINNDNKTYIRATTKGYGSVIYVEDFKNGNLKDGVFDIEIENVDFRYNEATYDGGSIYFNTDGGHKAKLKTNIIDSNIYFNKAGGSGGFAYINQLRYNENYNEKSTITLSPTTRDMVMYGNEAGANGGIFYIVDSGIEVDTPTTENYKITVGNQNYKNKAKEGGFIWQKRSISHLHSMQISYTESSGAGSVIYANGSEAEAEENYLVSYASQMHDSIMLGDTGRSFEITGNVPSGNNKGIVVIGTYSDLILNGAVKIQDAATHVDNTEVLYVRGEGLDSETLNNLGVYRVLLSDFDRANSLIYASVERMDKMLVSGWDMSVGTNYNDVFKPAVPNFE